MEGFDCWCGTSISQCTVAGCDWYMGAYCMGGQQGTEFMCWWHGVHILWGQSNCSSCVDLKR